MLSDYCDDTLTDKNTIHSYIEVYQELFASKKDTATDVLEVGIGPYMPNGGSIKMWNDYFTSAQIYALDIISLDGVNPILKGQPRINLYTSTNAYDVEFVGSTFGDKKFDIVLDDGPHTLESMLDFIKLYGPLLKSDGILVVEDVQDIKWIEFLRLITPDADKPFIKVFDRREVKGRYDDIIFVIDKRM
jgi:cephalosporin hydroxylase